MPQPRTIQEIADDYNARKEGLRKALTDGVSYFRFNVLLPSVVRTIGIQFPNGTDSDQLFSSCHPEKDNLCLYGAALKLPVVSFNASGALSDDCNRLVHAVPGSTSSLTGEPDSTWVVDLPAEEVPAELPEPCLGINFARDGMARKDWLALVAVHSDAWLLSVAFYYGAKLNSDQRCE
jgi:hypothetical protein